MCRTLKILSTRGEQAGEAAEKKEQGSRAITHHFAAYHRGSTSVRGFHPYFPAFACALISIKWQV
jgi:hypothetical protein